MDMATFKRESTLNREAYERMRDSVRCDFAGKYVALAHGKIIASAPTFDEARAFVEALRPVPEYYLVFSANDEPHFGLVYDLSGGIR
jgi:hypothetical protein